MTGLISKTFAKTLLRNLLTQVYVPALIVLIAFLVLAYRRKRA